MQCYFALKSDLDNNLIFDENDTHHLVNVLRFKINDTLIAVYEQQKYHVQIISCTPYLKVKILSVLSETTKLELKITLLMPLLKQERNDWIVQKATELGVYQIVPIILERSIIKINKDADQKKRILRWQKIAKEASSQSNRNDIPVITNILTNIKDIVIYKSSINLIANELESQPLTLKNLLKPQIKTVTFICGPEGGFSSKEVQFFKTAGFHSINLGRRVLRSETAMLNLLSNIVYEYENGKD